MCRLIFKAADDNESSESRNQIGVIAANSYRKIHGVPPVEYDPQVIVFIGHCVIQNR